MFATLAVTRAEPAKPKPSKALTMNRRQFLHTSPGILAMSSIAQSVQSLKEQMEKQIPSQHYDVIVLGVGSLGSATCYHLAKQGAKVLGLEQFDIPHEQGSHAGQSRIIRKAYFEHPDYVPLLEHAYKNWKELETRTGSQVYFPTGLLYLGPSDHGLLKGVHESADKYKVRVDSLSDEQMRRQYPQFNLPGDFEKLIEPDAGFLTPERAILLHAEQALRLGAHLRTKEKTLEFKPDAGGNMVVKTDKGTYTCHKLVITAGAWAGKLVPSLAPKLKVTRQILAWVQPKKWDDFELGKFPCWTVATPNFGGIFYGFPILPAGKFEGPVGLKLGHHYEGLVSDPDHVDRNPGPEEEQKLIGFLNKFMPNGYQATHVVKTCLYTYSPDENFVLDFLPEYGNKVAIATGCSGHAFKFAAGIGEIMADLALKGKTEQPIGFLNLKRLM
jgi:sarcosine oxidase